MINVCSFFPDVAKIGKQVLYYIEFEKTKKFLTSDNAVALCLDIVLEYLESNIDAAT